RPIVTDPQEWKGALSVPDNVWAQTIPMCSEQLIKELENSNNEYSQADVNAQILAEFDHQIPQETIITGTEEDKNKIMISTQKYVDSTLEEYTTEQIAQGTIDGYTENNSWDHTGHIDPNQGTSEQEEGRDEKL
ncbi:hypothetical protein IFR05_017601, partial [Cadophora sp. M221]